MRRYVKLAYPAALLLLFAVGMIVDLPFWQATLLGVIGMLPVALAEFLLTREGGR